MKAHVYINAVVRLTSALEIGRANGIEEVAAVSFRVTKIRAARISLSVRLPPSNCPFMTRGFSRSPVRLNAPSSGANAKARRSRADVLFFSARPIFDGLKRETASPAQSSFEGLKSAVLMKDTTSAQPLLP